MRLFTKTDAQEIRTNGHKMAKRRNPVYLQRQNTEFQVETNEGVLTGKPGDYLAHDPISGHVWPVSAEYVSQHYEPF